MGGAPPKLDGTTLQEHTEVGLPSSSTRSLSHYAYLAQWGDRIRCESRGRHRASRSESQGPQIYRGPISQRIRDYRRQPKIHAWDST